jgi:hypothetical protein
LQQQKLKAQQHNKEAQTGSATKVSAAWDLVIVLWANTKAGHGASNHK